MSDEELLSRISNCTVLLCSSNAASKCDGLWQINLCVQVISCKLIIIMESVDGDADVMKMIIRLAGSAFMWYRGPWTDLVRGPSLLSPRFFRPIAEWKILLKFV